MGRPVLDASLKPEEDSLLVTNSMKQSLQGDSYYSMTETNSQFLPFNYLFATSLVIYAPQ